MNLHLNFVENISHFNFHFTRLKSNTLNPTHKTVFQPLSSLYRNKPNAIPSFGLPIQTSIPAINIIKLNITPSCSSPIPPWLLTTPTILFDLLQSDMMQTKTSNTSSDIYIRKYNEIRSLCPQHIPIFTDGWLETK